MSLTDKTIKAGGWQGIAIILKVLLQVIVIGVLARHVLPEEFGYIAIANTVLAFAEMFGDVGVGPSLVQKKKLSDEIIRAAYTITIVLGIFITLILYLGSPLISRIFNADTQVDVIRWISISIILIKFGNMSKTLLQKEMKFHLVNLADIGAYVLGYSAVSIVMAVNGYGVWSLVAGRLTYCLLQSVILYILKPYSLKPIFSLTAYRDIMRKGLGFAAADFFNNIARQGHNFFVGALLGTQALGFYDRANTIAQLPHKNLGNIIKKVLFPAMSSIQSEKERLSKAYLRGINIISVIMFPVSVLLIVLAPEIVQVLLGSNWTSIVVVIQILSITITMKAVIHIPGALIKATGAVYKNTAITIVFAIVILTGTWYGHFYGLEGIAVAVSIAVTINYILVTRLSMKLVHCSFKEYLMKMINGILLGTVVLVSALPSVIALRMLTQSAVVVLASSGIFTLAFLLGAVFMFPGILGQDSLWIIRQVFNLSGIKIKRLERAVAYLERKM